MKKIYFRYFNAINLEAVRKNSVSTGFIILKVVIPYYLLAELLVYFKLLHKISFLFAPVTNILSLPPEASLILVAGILINLYAAIAFAISISLTPFEWTVIGLFLGVFHSIPVESTIMAKLKIKFWISIFFRFCMACTVVIPMLIFEKSIKQVFFDTNIIEHFAKNTEKYTQDLFSFVKTILYQVFIISFEIMILIFLIILFNELLKSLKALNKFSHQMSILVSMLTGFFVGITYGAGILIKEAQYMSRKQILATCFFLMVAHAMIEDVLLFVYFGANFTLLFGLRTFFAFIVFFAIITFYENFNKNDTRN